MGMFCLPTQVVLFWTSAPGTINYFILHSALLCYCCIDLMGDQLRVEVVDLRIWLDMLGASGDCWSVCRMYTPICLHARIWLGLPQQKPRLGFRSVLRI